MLVSAITGVYCKISSTFSMKDFSSSLLTSPFIKMFSEPTLPMTRMELMMAVW